VGVSPRQIDYWTVHGFLIAIDPVPGSGYARTWPAEELEVARRMVAYMQVGLSVRAANHAARHDGLLPGGAWQIKETTA
jgi:hypothetical protein